MLLLYIDTASSKQMVAVFENHAAKSRFSPKIIAKKTWKGHYDESSTVLPNIMSILKKAKKAFEDLEGIMVMKGPGSFSSIRIGATIANTLAFAIGIPVYGVKEKWHGKFPKPERFISPFYSKPPSITLRNQSK